MVGNSDNGNAMDGTRAISPTLREVEEALSRTSCAPVRPSAVVSNSDLPLSPAVAAKSTGAAFTISNPQDKTLLHIIAMDKTPEDTHDLKEGPQFRESSLILPTASFRMKLAPKAIDHSPTMQLAIPCSNYSAPEQRTSMPEAAGIEVEENHITAGEAFQQSQVDPYTQHRSTTTKESFANPHDTKARLRECVTRHIQHHQETIQSIYHSQQELCQRRLQQQYQQEQKEDQHPVQQGQSSWPSSCSLLSNNNNSHKKHWNDHSTAASFAATPMIIISGPSGSGKRSLGQMALQHVVEQQGGYFLQGHYDSSFSSEQRGNNASCVLNAGKVPTAGPGTVIPYSGFVQAFSSFAAQAVERDQVQVLRNAIYKQVVVMGERGEALSNTNVNVSVLTSMIPALEGIVGESSGNNYQQLRHHEERFILAFRMLLRAVSSQEHPLVLMLDDLHNADYCSLDLLTGIVTDSRYHNLLVIATCDDAQVSPDSYLARKLREIESFVVPGGAGWKMNVQHIAITPLSSENELCQWLRHAMDMMNDDDTEMVHRLTRLVRRHCTLNNWFLVIEFIRFLQESDLLLYRPFRRLPVDQSTSVSVNGTEGRWELASPEEIDVVLVNLNSPGEFLVEKLNQQLSEETKRVLTVAACLGSAVDVEMLGYVLNDKNNPGNIQESLEELVHRGLLTQNKESKPSLCGGKVCIAQKTLKQEFSFEDNEIRIAASALIGLNKSIDNASPKSPESFHLNIGRRLWKSLSSLSENDLFQHLFVVISQIYVGRHLIVQEEERVATATLCLYAGQKAAKAGTFRMAAVYLEMGIELLYNDRTMRDSNQDKKKYHVHHNRCWRDEYDLSLAMHRAAAEMTMACGEFDKTYEYVEQLLANARSFDDKFPAYTTKMSVLSQQYRLDECFDLGIWVLNQLGEKFPVRMCLTRYANEMRCVDKILRNKSNEQICRMPLLSEDSIQLRALQVLVTMALPAMSYRPKIGPLIMLKMAKITLLHGLSALASMSFAVYSMVCICIYRDVGKATRFAELALLLLERFRIVEYLPRVHAVVYGVVHSWTKPMRTALQPLLHAHRIGMQTGDAEYGGLCANIYCFYAMDAGFNLDEIRREWAGFQESLVTAKQQHILNIVLPTIQEIHHLMGLTDDPLASKGDLIDLDQFEKTAKDLGAFMAILNIKVYRMRLGYIFGDIEMAEKANVRFEDVMITPPTLKRVTFVFYIGLVAVAVAHRDLRNNSSPVQYRNNRKHLKDARKAEKMLMRYARSSPHNCLDKSNLLQAEIASLEGDYCKAYEKYLTAIALALENSHFYMHALSNELLAVHLIRLTRTGEAATKAIGRSRPRTFFSSAEIRDNKQKAKECLQRSIQSYRDWGGMAKVKRLEEKYSAILSGGLWCGT